MTTASRYLVFLFNAGGSRILGRGDPKYECGRKYAHGASGFLHIAVPTLPFSQELLCR